MKPDLSTLSIEELQEELKKREQVNTRPKELPNKDFSQVINTVREYVEDMIEQEWDNDDWRQYIFEAAVEAVYGQEFWGWKNKLKW